jgi:hypothetical protein
MSSGFGRRRKSLDDGAVASSMGGSEPAAEALDPAQFETSFHASLYAMGLFLAITISIVGLYLLAHLSVIDARPLPPTWAEAQCSGGRGCAVWSGEAQCEVSTDAARTRTRAVEVRVLARSRDDAMLAMMDHMPACRIGTIARQETGVGQPLRQTVANSVYN